MNLLALATLVTLGAAPADRAATSISKLQELERNWLDIRSPHLSHQAACAPEPVEDRVKRLIAGFKELSQEADGDTQQKAWIRLGDLQWYRAKLDKTAKVPAEVAKRGEEGVAAFKDAQANDEREARAEAVEAWSKGLEMADKASQDDLEIQRVRAQLRVASPDRD